MSDTPPGSRNPSPVRVNTPVHRVSRRQRGLPPETPGQPTERETMTSSSLVTEAADVGNVASTRGEKASAWASVGVVLVQRCLFLWRRWPASLLSWLLPVLLLVAAFRWTSSAVRRFEPVPPGVVRMPLSLRIFYPRANCFVEAEQGIERYYQSLMQKEGALVTAYNGTAHSDLLSYAKRSYVEYTQHFVLGAVFWDPE
ncbi:hypothetical protein HPB50_027683 [Hyalomma asiaticum]|nr:hypothetical protein HPB50_027683 [Hyalomma asiaticum]